MTRFLDDEKKIVVVVRKKGDVDRIWYLVLCSPDPPNAIESSGIQKSSLFNSSMGPDDV